MLGRSIGLVVLVGGSLLVGRADAQEQPLRDGMHYRLGGVMSGPIDLTIDFDNGNSVIREVNDRRPSASAGFYERQLIKSEITLLRRLATTAMKEGLETKACFDARKKGAPRMPIADALLDMQVALDGRTTDAPTRPDCWSSEANALQTAAYRIAKVGRDKSP